jgi:hypothetical protein
MNARVTIRASSYRGEPGFSINGRDSLGRRLKIFATTRTAAERIKAKVKQGQSIELQDFKP